MAGQRAAVLARKALHHLSVAAKRFDTKLPKKEAEEVAASIADLGKATLQEVTERLARAREKAKLTAQADQREHLLAWKVFAKQGSANGAAAGHRWTKLKSGLGEGELPRWNGDNFVVEPLLLAEKEGEPWFKLWASTAAKEIAESNWPEPGLQYNVLETKTTDDLRAVLGSFPRRTGIGGDEWDPRTLLYLSEGAMAALLLLLVEIEKVGRWPPRMLQIFVVLLPKPPGARAP